MNYAASTFLRRLQKEPEFGDKPSEAMENLVHTLISDRLLELSRYVWLDPASKMIRVDRAALDKRMVIDWKSSDHVGHFFSLKNRINKQN